MKRYATSSLVLCLAATLGACSSIPEQRADYAGARSCDYEQMARLEKMAKQERAELHWVNCPQLSASVRKS
jgi:hypothetical protein